MINKKNSGLFVFLSVAILFMGCEKKPDSEISASLNKEYLKKKVWISVDKNGNPRVKDLQKCTLVFLSNNEYEVRKTFEYSGSTFRNPGIYEITDSLIKLKSPNGSEHLGNVFVYEKNMLKIEWLQSDLIYGEGTEVFKPIKDEIN